MILATLLVTTLYLMLNYIFLFTTPIELMKGKVEIGYIVSTNFWTSRWHNEHWNFNYVVVNFE